MQSKLILLMPVQEGLNWGPQKVIFEKLLGVLVHHSRAVQDRMPTSTQQTDNNIDDRTMLPREK